jgi:hypothetical protein
MQVNVIFFGVLSDVVGKNMLTIQDTGNMTCLLYTSDAADD